MANFRGGSGINNRLNPSIPTTPLDPPEKKKLIVRDSVTFALLLGSAVILFVATSALFQSFSARREQIATQLAITGKTALENHHPEDAVTALRASLEYEPGVDANRELLADALAQTGKTDEAISHFLSLRENRPADGEINLQLARLSRRKGDNRQAVEFYRAASLGNWNDNGVEHRRQAQLELSDALLAQGDAGAARAELLAAAANTLETAASDRFFGDKLLQANDTATAELFYSKAARLDPQGATMPDQQLDTQKNGAVRP